MKKTLLLLVVLFTMGGGEIHGLVTRQMPT